MEPSNSPGIPPSPSSSGFTPLARQNSSGLLRMGSLRPTKSHPHSPPSRKLVDQLNINSLQPFLPRVLKTALYSDTAATALSPQSWSVECALLFVDIAGFSSFTEKMSEATEEGLELMSATVNSIFAKITSVITGCGGDAVSFSGDSVLCLWPVYKTLESTSTLPQESAVSVPTEPTTASAPSKDERIDGAFEQVINMAQSCAVLLQRDHAKFSTKYGSSSITLGLHMGLGVGRVRCHIVGDQSSGLWRFVVTGAPLVDAATALAHSREGEVVAYGSAMRHSSGIADGSILCAPLTSARPEGSIKEHKDLAAFSLLTATSTLRHPLPAGPAESLDIEPVDDVMDSSTHERNLSFLKKRNAADAARVEASARRGLLAADDTDGGLTAASENASSSRLDVTGGNMQRLRRSVHLVSVQSRLNNLLSVASETESAASSVDVSPSISPVSVMPPRRNRVPARVMKGRFISFLMNPLVEALASSHTVLELRNVTVLFLRFATTSKLAGADTPSDYMSSPNLSKQVHPVQEQLQTIITHFARGLGRYGGLLNKIQTDDKGVIALVCFGLPGNAHLDDPVRACRFALEFVADIEPLIGNVYVGISSSRVYCGIVGGESHREYSVLGDGVNIAARLMSHCSDAGDADRPIPGHIVADESTIDATEGIFVTISAESMGVKGRKALVNACHVISESFADNLLEEEEVLPSGIMTPTSSHSLHLYMSNSKNDLTDRQPARVISARGSIIRTNSHALVARAFPTSGSVSSLKQSIPASPALLRPSLSLPPTLHMMYGDASVVARADICSFLDVIMTTFLSPLEAATDTRRLPFSSVPNIDDSRSLSPSSIVSPMSWRDEPKSDGAFVEDLDDDLESLASEIVVGDKVPASGLNTTTGASATSPSDPSDDLFSQLPFHETNPAARSSVTLSSTSIPGLNLKIPPPPGEDKLTRSLGEIPAHPSIPADKGGRERPRASTLPLPAKTTRKHSSDIARLVVMFGSPGAGKSHMIRLAARAARKLERLVIIHCRGQETDASVPWGTFRASLAVLTAEADQKIIERALSQSDDAEAVISFAFLALKGDNTITSYLKAQGPQSRDFPSAENMICINRFLVDIAIQCLGTVPLVMAIDDAHVVDVVSLHFAICLLTHYEQCLVFLASRDPYLALPPAPVVIRVRTSASTTTLVSAQGGLPLASSSSTSIISDSLVAPHLSANSIHAAPKTRNRGATFTRKRLVESPSNNDNLELSHTVVMSIPKIEVPSSIVENPTRAPRSENLMPIFPDKRRGSSFVLPSDKTFEDETFKDETFDEDPPVIELPRRESAAALVATEIFQGKKLGGDGGLRVEPPTAGRSILALEEFNFGTAPDSASESSDRGSEKSDAASAASQKAEILEVFLEFDDVIDLMEAHTSNLTGETAEPVVAEPAGTAAEKRHSSPRRPKRKSLERNAGGSGPLFSKAMLRKFKFGNLAVQCARFNLRSLSLQETGVLASVMLECTSISSALERHLFERSSGIPGLVEQELRYLFDESLLFTGCHGAVITNPHLNLSDLPCPPAIQTMVTSLTDSLSADQRAVLRAGSVVGESFALIDVLAIFDLLPTSAEIDPVSLADAKETVRHYHKVMESLNSLNLLVEVNPDDAPVRPTCFLLANLHAELNKTYAFRAGVVLRSSLYKMTLFSERRTQHARLAKWLKSSGDEAAIYADVVPVSKDIPFTCVDARVNVSIAHHLSFTDEAEEAALNYALAACAITHTAGWEAVVRLCELSLKEMRRAFPPLDARLNGSVPAGSISDDHLLFSMELLLLTCAAATYTTDISAVARFSDHALCLDPDCSSYLSVYKGKSLHDANYWINLPPLEKPAGCCGGSVAPAKAKKVQMPFSKSFSKSASGSYSLTDLCTAAAIYIHAACQLHDWHKFSVGMGLLNCLLGDPGDSTFLVDNYDDVNADKFPLVKTLQSAWPLIIFLFGKALALFTYSDDRALELGYRLGKTGLLMLAKELDVSDYSAQPVRLVVKPHIGSLPGDVLPVLSILQVVAVAMSLRVLERYPHMVRRTSQIDHLFVQYLCVTPVAQCPVTQMSGNFSVGGDLVELLGLQCLLRGSRADIRLLACSLMNFGLATKDVVPAIFGRVLSGLSLCITPWCELLPGNQPRVATKTEHRLVCVVPIAEFLEKRAEPAAKADTSKALVTFEGESFYNGLTALECAAGLLKRSDQKSVPRWLRFMVQSVYLAVRWATCVSPGIIIELQLLLESPLFEQADGVAAALSVLVLSRVAMEWVDVSLKNTGKVSIDAMLAYQKLEAKFKRLSRCLPTRFLSLFGVIAPLFVRNGPDAVLASQSVSGGVLVPNPSEASAVDDMLTSIISLHQTTMPSEESRVSLCKVLSLASSASHSLGREGRPPVSGPLRHHRVSSVLEHRCCEPVPDASSP